MSIDFLAFYPSLIHASASKVLFKGLFVYCHRTINLIDKYIKIYGVLHDMKQHFRIT